MSINRRELLAAAVGGALLGAIRPSADEYLMQVPLDWGWFEKVDGQVYYCGLRVSGWAAQIPHVRECDQILIGGQWKNCSKEVYDHTLLLSIFGGK